MLPISLMFQSFNLKFTSLLSSLVSVSPFMLPLFGIHSLKTFVHHPLLPLLEKSSKPISTQRLILLSSFSLMASLWCRPISVPGLCILHIAIVLLRLRVHYSVEIKCYKSQVRIRISPSVSQVWPGQDNELIFVQLVYAYLYLRVCHMLEIEIYKILRKIDKIKCYLTNSWLYIKLW